MGLTVKMAAIVAVTAMAMVLTMVPTGHNRLLDVVAGAVLAGPVWFLVRGRRRRSRRPRGYAGWDGLDLHKTDDAA
ncbi:hypothetical protein ACQP2P_39245 [Dactylosporangium sp. CA-139114]|uniref:hypothetical protein n=1 Tax=Dactylosporangium sp. CA-139114 TaxID=3239931 RepID=UPI003D99F963